jgi:hypothetical protein
MAASLIPEASVNPPLERSSGRKYSENLDFWTRTDRFGVKNKTPDQVVTCGIRYSADQWNSSGRSTNFGALTME